MHGYLQYAHLHGRTDTHTCKPTINARTRRHKMYAKDKQNTIDIIRIVSEIKSKYRGDARTRTPTNYHLSEQTEFVICIILILRAHELVLNVRRTYLPASPFGNRSYPN